MSTFVLFPDERHLPQLAADTITVRDFLFATGPSPTWLLRRKLGIGTFQLRRVLANTDWFTRTGDNYWLTDESILTAQAESPTITTKGEPQ